MTLNCFDLDALRAAPLKRDPFDYVVVPNFLRKGARAKIHEDFPKIAGRGSYPIGQLSFGAGFQHLLDELETDELRHAFEEKFDMTLPAGSTLVTVRGHTSAQDGGIHTDSATKIISTLIYMNSNWNDAGGCLRMLRSKDNIEDFAEEIQPLEGTLVAFRRSERSWHGHKPFVGERRAVQFHWVTPTGPIRMIGHHWSAQWKRVFGGAQPKM